MIKWGLFGGGKDGSMYANHKGPQGQLLAFSQLRQDRERHRQQSHRESTHGVEEGTAEHSEMNSSKGGRLAQ